MRRRGCLTCSSLPGKASGWMRRRRRRRNHLDSPKYTKIHRGGPKSAGDLSRKASVLRPGDPGNRAGRGESSNWILRMRVRLQPVADICRFGGGSGELRR
jgi:hypothetical protein